MLLYTVITLVCLLYTTKAAHHLNEGIVRFYRNGVADESQTWSSGIVQIYYSGSWGNICDQVLYFGANEADVLCHQFGYEGASSYSNTGTTTTYGTDESSTAIENVDCSSSAYLVITQCNFASSSSVSCTDNTDIIVTCSSDRIWASPTAGDIRLTGGDYSNQGLLEIYCNEEWGTVCDNSFDGTDADAACKQLGYNAYHDYDHLTNRGESSENIWLNTLGICSSSSTCLTSCQNCPLTAVNSCIHIEDVTLQCSYDSSGADVYSSTTDVCTIDLSGLVAAIIAAYVIGVFICCVVCILIATVPFCICCCLGVGVGAAAGGSRRPTTTVVAQPGYQPSSATYPPQQYTGGELPPKTV